ncbi:MAG TPA: type II toxin-antitoxin system HipA family toxin [Pseudomonas sp.]|nr:type II toxin-antitoxin system HipA family toxin [Pseudomonas sp.]
MSSYIPKFKPTESLSVTANGVMVGELSRVEGKGIYFVYDKEWLAKGFDLSPLTMTFDDKPQLARESHLFKGLHGPFADSLPDGWGLLLMDRFFDATFGAGTSLTLSPLDRLAYIGDRGMGIFEYHPKAEKVAAESVNLARLFEASVEVQQGDTPKILKGLRLAGGSPGGARPKAIAALSHDLETATSAFGQLPPGYAHWLVKFRSLNEPLETGGIEQAYAVMARKAGVNMAHTELLEVQMRQGGFERFFAAKRFDRDGDRRIHMMTVSALVYADFRAPTMDYSQLLKLTSALTKSAAEVEKMARLMIFNAVFHNYDDHTKNFAFLYHESQDKNGQGAWKLSPAYDLTFSDGMGEHSTAFSGHGKPTRKVIRDMCKDYKYLKPDEYIDQTLAALDDWDRVLGTLKIPKSGGAAIHRVLSDARVRFEGDSPALRSF